MSWHAFVLVCLRCPRREPAAPLHLCREDGRPCQEHARAGACPLGRFKAGGLEAMDASWRAVHAERARARAGGEDMDNGCGCSPPPRGD